MNQSFESRDAVLMTNNEIRESRLDITRDPIVGGKCRGFRVTFTTVRWSFRAKLPRIYYQTELLCCLV